MAAAVKVVVPMGTVYKREGQQRQPEEQERERQVLGHCFHCGDNVFVHQRVWFPFDTDDATGVLRVTCGICSGRERRGAHGKKK